MTDEIVWTSRRALLASPSRTWTTGRLRISDRAVRFTAQDGAVVEVPLDALTEVRVVRVPRRVLVLETADGPLRLRCFAIPAVAGLLHGSGRMRATPLR